MFDPQDLADRYLDAFNEPDADTRARKVAALWAPDGEHHGGFVGKGHAELTAGIEGSHNNWIKGQGWTWVPQSPALVRQNMVHFLFAAVPVDNPDAVMASGAQVMVVGEDGRLTADYTFVLKAPD